MDQSAAGYQTAKISAKETNSDLLYEKNTVVEIRLSLPFFSATGDRRAEKSLNRFYDFVTRALLRYGKSSLYNQAVARYKENVASGVPFRPSALRVSFFASHDGLNLLSVVLDRYEYDGGANGFTVRTAVNWHMPEGSPVMRLFPRGANRHVLRECTAIAREQQRAGTHVYFEGLTKNMRRYFQAEQSYVTPEGLTVFYQEVTISPHAEGTPAFTLTKPTR